MKINQEHFSTIERFSSFFKCKPSCFSYAGMKDKCAVTYQHMVVEGLSPSHLLSINKSDDISGIKVGDVEFVNSSMVSSHVVMPYF
jgi:tRNA(Glu) U13 pseudouridine synthase TruD